AGGTVTSPGDYGPAGPSPASPRGDNVTQSKRGDDTEFPGLPAQARRPAVTAIEPVFRVDYNVVCLWPQSLQAYDTRCWPGAMVMRFLAPHLPQVASIRVSPCFTVTDFFSIASLMSRSASSRIACFDISTLLCF